MAIAVNSFETLDKDLEIGIRELTEVIDNKVYSIRQDIEDGILNFVNDFIGPVKDVFNKVTDTANMIINAATNVINSIGRAIDRIVDSIMGAVTNSYTYGLLQELKHMDDKGVRDFLTVSTGAGSTFYCYNLDSLQALLEGAFLDPNVVDGLLMGLMLDWSNVKCKSMSPVDEYRSTNKELLDVLSPYTGFKLDKNNVITKFESTMKGFLNWNKIPFMKAAGEPNYVEELKSKKPSDLIEAFGGKCTRSKKTAITNKLNAGYAASKDSKHRSKILEFKGLVNTLPEYSREEAIASSNLPNNKDVLGGFIKNLEQVDLNTVSKVQLNPNQKSLLESLVKIKKLAKSEDFVSRGYKEGEFHDYDFKTILSLIESEDQLYIMGNDDIEIIGHRYNGLHPTSEVFISDKVHRSRKELPHDPTESVELSTIQ